MKPDQKPMVVIGGGTAGWLSALFAKHYYPDTKVIVIASEKIGILGAGEGTTPSFLPVLRSLNICIEDFVAECDVTIKNGIVFENWCGKNDSYFHSFFINSANEFGLPLSVRSGLLAEYSSLDSVSLGQYLNKTKRVFSIYDTKQETAVHFNAIKMAAYLKKIALKRGIKYIEDTVTDIGFKDNQDIEKINLEHNDVVYPCFVFDCSGLKRIFIGGKYNTEWCDYASELTTDSAIPFFIPHNNDVIPATKAIAMKHGWAWKIPVKNRYGCGYVYDSKKVAEKDVISEIQEFFDIELNDYKKFNFKAGVYKEVLKNNVLAVGLSSGFIEPLEATSIWCSTTSLDLFFQSDGVNNKSNFFAKQFNKYMFDFNEHIKNFIVAHYQSGRKDTEFWNQFNNLNKNKMSEEMKSSLNYNIDGSDVLSSSNAFGAGSWSCVLAGTNQLDKDMLQIRAKDDRDIKKEALKFLQQNQNGLIFSDTVSHKDFIELKTPPQGLM